MKKTKQRHILIGNSFPMGLIRRPAQIEPISLEALKQTLEGANLHSFWGHPDTLGLAEKALGLSLRPRTYRPALRLDRRGFPTLNGRSFRECFILTPEYAAGYRPPLGGSKAGSRSDAHLKNWRALRIFWNEDQEEMKS